MKSEEVHLWNVALKASAAATAQAHGLLSSVERGRVSAILDDPRAARLALARAALRVILGRYLGVEPGDVALTYTPSGKPILAADPSQLAFNVSHSGELAVIAVARREAVGVDIEQLGRHPHPEGLLDRVLTPSEARAVRALPPEERERALLLRWTAKEAYLKAIGTGWDRDPRTLDVASEGAPFTLQHFDPGPGVVGSVLVAGGPWRAVARSLEEGYLG